MKTNASTSIPIAWTIAGSDSSGGAGIQADLKTFANLGVHGCSAITAVTAQNSQKISDIHYVKPSVLAAQLKSLSDDVPARAVKIGMLGNEANIRALARFLEHFEPPVICDPVLTSTSGRALLDATAVELFKKLLCPEVSLLTPNIPEAASLTRHEINTPDDVVKAAERILRFGCSAVLIKGGHSEGSIAADYFTDGAVSFWMTTPRIENADMQGTGCILSSAITAGLAIGLDLHDAVVIAKAYIQESLTNARSIGSGQQFAGHRGFPASPEFFPRVYDSYPDSARPQFPPITFPNCPLYPIVDSADWVERILNEGVKIVQLRLKTNPEADGPSEIKRAIELGKQYNATVVINDDWKTALACGATAVHLGQDDLAEVDLQALVDAGITLGLSTHNYVEVARALGFNPSTIAIGTVYHTDSKTFDFTPLGLNKFAALCRVIDLPVIAIGGLTVENAGELIASGAESTAVISDITLADDPAARIAEWKGLFNQ